MGNSDEAQEMVEREPKRSTSFGLSCRSKLLLFFLFILILILLISILYLFVFMNYAQDTAKEAENKQLNLTTNDLVQYSSAILFSDWHALLYMTRPIRIYNSKERNWSYCKPQLPYSLGEYGAALLNNEIYIFGRYDKENKTLGECHKLDQDNNWIKVAAMKEERSGIARSSVVFNSEIWVFGGFRKSKRFFGEEVIDNLQSVEKYDPKTNIWIKMPNMLEKRSNAAVSVIAGKMYISGGWNGTNVLKSVEVYDPSNNQREFFTDMPFGLYYHSSEVEGNHLIIIGGDRSFNSYWSSNEVWKIDVTHPKKEWIKMPSLNAGRRGHGSVKLYNDLTVIGGSSSIELLNEKSWIQKEADFGVDRPVLIPLTWENESKFRQQLLCVN